MIVFGGMRSLLGPALGALIFVLFRDGLGTWIPGWLMLPALLFFAFVLCRPNGLAGLIARWLPSWHAPEDTTEQPVASDTTLPSTLAAPDRKTGAVLIARELAKSHDGFRAAAGVDIVVEAGTLHALVGPNGAGKTTVLDLLSGVRAPDAGFVTVAGRALTGRAPGQFARAGVVPFVPDPSLFGKLTVAQNIRLALEAARGKRPRWKVRPRTSAAVEAETVALLRYFGLLGVAPNEASSLSLTEQRRLDIALAFAAGPRVLLLDQPFADIWRIPNAPSSPALISEISPGTFRFYFHGATIDQVHCDRRCRPRSCVAAACKTRNVHDANAPMPISDVPPSAAGATTLLALERVSTFNGRTPILNGVSLDVSENEIVALLGRDGAGKSTLLKTLIGLAPPSGGSIRLAGAEIARLPPATIAQRGIGYVPQDRGLFAGMTVADNLALGRQKPQGASPAPWDDDRILWAFPRLARRWYTPVDQLSVGEQQMTAAARALAGGVHLLLLDEPFEGASPAITAELFEAFDRLRYEIAMMIVGDHDPALALADRAVILDQGTVSWSGQAKLLRDILEKRNWGCKARPLVSLPGGLGTGTCVATGCIWHDRYLQGGRKDQEREAVPSLPSSRSGASSAAPGPWCSRAPGGTRHCTTRSMAPPRRRSAWSPRGLDEPWHRHGLVARVEGIRAARARRQERRRRARGARAMCRRTYPRRSRPSARSLPSSMRWRRPTLCSPRRRRRSSPASSPRR